MPSETASAASPAATVSDGTDVPVPKAASLENFLCVATGLISVSSALPTDATTGAAARFGAARCNRRKALSICSSKDGA
nr:hypothetical protein [Neisseria lactamica]